VTTADREELAANVLGGDLKFSKRVTYNFLLDKNTGARNNEPVTISSEIFS